MSSKGAKDKAPRKSKNKKIRTVHQKLKLFRASEPLLSVFMWGVNHRVSELEHVPIPKLLIPEDFKAFAKTKVDNQNFNKDVMPSHFKFKEYCPHVFRDLRERFKVHNYMYLRSLTSRQANATHDAGRSGARFFVSHDGLLLIKSMAPEEVGEVHNILEKYHQYVVTKQGRTLLPQLLGMYRITVESTEHYLLVMRNIFGGRFVVHKKFDLKGSTVQRQASEKERTKDLPTYKDNDFLEENCRLYLPTDEKDELMSKLEADTQFLSKLHIMDYSLLVGIHDVELAQEAGPATANRGHSSDEAGALSGENAEGEDSCDEEYSQPTPPDSPLPSVGAFGDFSASHVDLFYAIPSAPEAPRRQVYFVGLIDILTHYGMKKRTASAAKSVKYGSEAEGISTVKPDLYAQRLCEFIGRTLAT